jgi:hypothetical protein
LGILLNIRDEKNNYMLPSIKSSKQLKDLACTPKVMMLGGMAAMAAGMVLTIVALLSHTT